MTPTRYTIADAAALATVGLPLYMLGTWDHYNTHLGEVRLARVSGKGRKFASLTVEDFAAAIKYGLVKAA